MATSGSREMTTLDAHIRIETEPGLFYLPDFYSAKISFMFDV